MASLPRDENLVPVLGLVDASTGAVRPALADSVTGRLLVSGTGGGGFTNPMTTLGDIITGGVGGTAQRLGVGAEGTVLSVVGGVPAWAAVGGTGTVTSVSVVSANGFAGTVANATTTPAITLTTTVTGILSGNGTAISAASTTGSGAVVLANTPTLITPVLGVAAATTINKVTLTAPATGSTLTIADGKTLTASNTLTFTGTDGSSVAFGAGGTVLYTTSTVPLTVGSTTIASGTTTRVLFDNSGVLGEYTISGTGNVAMTTSPSFTTPTLGVASATSINKVAITAPATSATLTIADGKTLTVSNSLTLAGTDSTTMTFPTTSASIARTDAGQTFTGVQAMTSPDITTSLTTPSTTFSLVNATATTVNFAGAATTLNMAGGSGAVINLGGGANAAELRFLEPSGSGTNYSAFKAQAQGANITYTLPATVGAAGTVLTDAAGNGTLSWAAAGGSFSWGATASGTTADGLTLTASNSTDASASALKLVAGNTQTNVFALGNIQIGTSGNTLGLLIQGTGSTTGGALGTGKNHLTLWGDTATNGNRVLSIGNGTSYTENAFITARGAASFVTAGSNTPLTVGQNTATSLFSIIVNTSGTNFSGGLIQANNTSSASTSAKTSAFIETSLVRTRTATSGSITDNYNYASFIRGAVQNGAGGTFVQQGSVGYFENQATQTAGTLTDSVVVAKFVQDTDSTGDILQAILGSTTKWAVDKNGNVLLAGATAGSSAVGVLAMSNGATAPTTAVDLVQLFAVDNGAGHATLGIVAEEVITTETVVSDTTFPIKINGTIYKVCLKA